MVGDADYEALSNSIIALVRDRDPTLSAIPVLVISAAPQDRLLEAKVLGADAFISKPFDFDVLSTMVRGLLG